MLRHRRVVGLAWLVVGLVGVALVGQATARLTPATTYPGLASYEAGVAIAHTYGNGGNDAPTVVVVSLPHGESVTSTTGAAALSRTWSAVAADPTLRVVHPARAQEAGLVNRSGRSALGLVYGSADAVRIGDRLRSTAPPGVTVAATGLTALYGAPGGGSREVLGEVVLGAAGALVVLVLVFGSFLALLPLLVALVSILTTFLLLGAVTTVTEVSQIVEYLVALIGLGVAIDYSLLLVTRWREERAQGRSGDDAVVAAMSTAGRSVVFSGVTVGISLLSLVLLPVPFLRSLGYGGLLIPLVTVAAATTLLPVLLAMWGPSLDRRARRPHARSHRPGEADRRWARWTRTVVTHRAPAVVGSVLVLLVLLGAATGLHAGEVGPGSLARSGAAERGLLAVEHAGFPSGVLAPIEVLVPNAGRTDAVASAMRTVPGVVAVAAPDTPAWRRGGTAVLDVLPAGPTSTATGSATLAKVRSTLARVDPGARVAGDGAEEGDIVHAFYVRFPLIVAVVALLSVLALARALRSVVLALQAVLLTLVSVGASYGALVILWQHGLGSHAVWGVPATGVVPDFVPLVLFAFLFGLSMDYAVFILSRVKEAHDAGRSTDDAVVEGLAHTGRLVTSAALILFFAFAALASGPSVPMKVFASGMAVGVLLDATLVRAVLLPALVSLVGQWNWWPSGRGRGAVDPPVPERTLVSVGG